MFSMLRKYKLNYIAYLHKINIVVFACSENINYIYNTYLQKYSSYAYSDNINYIFACYSCLCMLRFINYLLYIRSENIKTVVFAC